MPNEAVTDGQVRSGGDLKAWLIMALIILACSAALLSQTKDYDLLGWDTYPLIAASRVQTWSDLAGNFTERLMDGRYQGEFYRPVLNLAIALDYSLWGLNPFGYQLTGVLWLAGCAAAVGALIRRLLGRRARVVPPVAVLLFLLHPALFEVLPVLARRAEILCCLFMALSIFMQLDEPTLSRRGVAWLAALPSWLAMGSKETAFVLPLLGFGAVALCSPSRGVFSRLRHGVMGMVPHLAALGVMLGMRLAVLGGIGGYSERSASEVLGDFPGYLKGLTGAVLFPQGVSRQVVWVPWILVAGLAAVGAGIGIGWFRRGERHRTASGRPWQGAGLGLLWFGLVSFVYSAAGAFSAWYLLLPLAGWVIGVSSVAEGMMRAARDPDRWRRWGALTVLFLGLSLLGWQVRYSPLIHGYGEWERASQAGREFLTRLEGRIAAAGDGTVLTVADLPMRVQVSRNQPAVRSASILADYSVQAWADLTFPHRRVRVLTDKARREEARVDEVLVLLTGRRPEF